MVNSPRLAHAYDEVIARYSPGVLDVAQDGPQNQIESNRALLAVSTDSGPEATKHA